MQGLDTRERVTSLDSEEMLELRHGNGDATAMMQSAVLDYLPVLPVALVVQQG